MIVLAMTMGIIAVLSLLALKIYFKAAGIQPGVRFLGYDMAGLKVNDAATRIGQIIDYVYADPVYLKYQKNLWMLRYQKHFKLQVDATTIALAAVKVGEKKTVYQRLYDWLTLNFAQQELDFTPALDRKFSQSNIAARLSRVASNKIFAKPLPDGRVRVIAESSGAGINAILDALERSFKDQPFVERRVVEVASQERAGTTTDVELFDPKYGFTVVLQTKTSTVESADPATFDNIVLACQRISGVMLNPGDIFSYNRVVGERTVRGGFKESSSHRSIGIGVGQVSSTMYEPVLRAGCKILERHRHSFWYPELKFASPGLDAAVTDAGWDLRFENQANIPMLLVASLKGAKLTFEIRSVQEPPYRIDLHTGKATRVPFRTDWVKDPSVPRGQQRVEVSGIEGTRVKIYRTWLTREEGRKEREETISDDEYQRRNAVVRVPPGFVPPPEPKAEPPKPAAEPAVPIRRAKPRPDEDEAEPAPREPAIPMPSPTVTEDTEPEDRAPRGDDEEPAETGSPANAAPAAGAEQSEVEQ